MGLTRTGFYKSCTSGDVNRDGLPDIFLSDYKGNNILYLHNGEVDNVQFKDESEAWGIDAPFTSFSSWMFDYNNDGFEDIFVSGYGDGTGKMSPAYAAGANYTGTLLDFTPIIYKNLAGRKFEKLSKEIGLTKMAYTMGCSFGDFDNDGFEDFYLGTGDPSIASIVPNLVYKNKGGKEFEDMSFQSGMAHLQKGHGVSFADFDRDGDQDLYMVLGGAYEGDAFFNALFENPSKENGWVSLQLKGKKSNQCAIGAKVEVIIQMANGAKRSIHRTVNNGSSFGGNSILLEVGLGKAVKIVSVKVHWPNLEKSVDRYENLELRKSFLLKEGGEFSELDWKPIGFKPKTTKHHHH